MDNGVRTPAPRTLRTVGYTTACEYEALSAGYTKFSITAEGDGQTATGDYGISGVTGDLEGSFRFEECGLVDFDSQTGQGSGEGVNAGIMTIVSNKDGEVILAFRGRSTFETVSGRFDVLRGAGGYVGLRGWGTYEGVPDFCGSYPPGPDTCTGFYVDFTFEHSFYGRSD